MPNLHRAHFDEALKKYATRDPELHKELTAKIAPPSTELVAHAMQHAGMAPEEALTADDGGVTPQGVSVAETIVRPNARPVLVIRDNRATIEAIGPDSEVWASRIQAAQGNLDRVIPAVGRVEVGNNRDFPWVGTGWLVANDIIVTNRHVAREFGQRGTAGFTFRVGTNGGPMTSRVDFLEEVQRSAALEYPIVTILWIAPASEPDVAFLRIVRPPAMPVLARPIGLATSVTEDEFIAAIGYPARDPRVPDQDLVRRVFGDVYEKKRLAPGQVMSVKPDEVEHDCSTLGGNSGSALVRLGTGEAVGLHFSGLFMQANFAVAAPKVRELLQRVRQGELPGAAVVKTQGQGAAVTPVAPVTLAPTPTATPGTYTIQLQIPIEITVRVGGVTLPSDGRVAPVAPSAGGGDPLDNALRAAKEAVAGDPDVIDVRLGYRFKRGWITDERVVVVEVRNKLSSAELAASGKRPLPPQILGIGVDVRTAALMDQLEHLGVDLEALEARAKPGLYHEPPNLSLDRVKEPMKALFHVSPDSGFPNLKAFLGRVKRHLTATMYEWDPNHISDAIEAAMARSGHSLTMVTQRKGTEEAVDDMQRRLGGKFRHVWASVGAGRLIPSAYHIKVASRDGEEFWLSSGNWKDSNQADINPAGDHTTGIAPLRGHNREWHAIIRHPKLAALFQSYIEFDFAEAQRVPVPEGIEVALPDVFVPEEAFMEAAEARVQVQYFDPLPIDRELDVQPLLTPDRDARGHRLFMTHALEMVEGARRKVYVQNQSFNLLADNADEFETFFGALRDKQKAGLDVRVIFRDGREFSAANGAKQQQLLEHLKDFGIDTDFVRVQRKCHTKGIIVDSAEVMLGSHNLTNEGSLFNRDASLRVRDADVAQYFEKIFLFDWEVLAAQESDELVGGIRIANPGEETPAGFRRVSVAELLGES